MEVKKNPLGCKPAYIAYANRIDELIGAIERYAEDGLTIRNVQLIKKWAIEVEEICNLLMACGTEEQT